jgi:hypothetical protein
MTDNNNSLQKYEELLNSEYEPIITTIIDSVYQKLLLQKKINIIMFLLNDILSLIKYDKINKIGDFTVIYNDVITIDVDDFLKKK